MVILFEKLKSLFSGEKLSACGTADAGGKLPSGDQPEGPAAALLSPSLTGAVLREGKRASHQDTSGRHSFVWLWLGETVFGEVSSREERPALVPAPAGRLHSLRGPSQCQLPVCIPRAYVMPFSIGIKEEEQARTTCGHPASVHALRPCPPSRPGCHLLGRPGPADRSECPGYTLCGGAVPIHLSPCSYAALVSVFPVRRCRETRPGRHFPLRLQAQDRVCRLAGLRHPMTRNRITGGKQQFP